MLLYKAWHQSSQSLWSALVNVRESPDSLRMTLPHSARAPMHPTSLPMLAQFLQCMRTTAHDVAVGCVQGVLDMVLVICLVVVAVCFVYTRHPAHYSHFTHHPTHCVYRTLQVSAQEGQVTFPADLRTPGTLLHATRHVLDWVLDEYMDVLFCQGIEVWVLNGSEYRAGCCCQGVVFFQGRVGLWMIICIYACSMYTTHFFQRPIITRKHRCWWVQLYMLVYVRTMATFATL